MDSKSQIVINVAEQVGDPNCGFQNPKLWMRSIGASVRSFLQSQG